MNSLRSIKDLTSYKGQAGFTLIEIVVALGIFATIIIISLGIFTNFVVNQRAAIEEEELHEDIRLVLELMNREIRTGFGTTFGNIGSDQSTLAFRNEDRNCVLYSLIGTRITRAQVTTSAVADCQNPALYVNDKEKIPINDPNTGITQINFVADRAGTNTAGDTLTSQGLVTMLLTAGRKTNSTEIKIQSSISSRQIRPY